MNRRAVLGVVVGLLLFLGIVPPAFSCGGITLVSMTPTSANIGTGGGETVSVTVNYTLGDSSGCGFWYLKVNGSVVGEIVNFTTTFVRPLVAAEYSVTVSNSTVYFDSNALIFNFTALAPPPSPGPCDGSTGGDLVVCNRVEAVRVALASQAASVDGLIGLTGTLSTPLTAISSFWTEELLYFFLGVGLAMVFVRAVGTRW